MSKSNIPDNSVIEEKLNNYKNSVNKREDDLKDQIKSQISTAEISNIIFENVTDSQKPFVHKYKVRIPGYAQKTGKRIFLQPGFFEFGKNPLFSTAERRYSIYFHYPWSEEDNITIELPKNFELDNADSPAGVGDSGKVSSLDIKIGIDKDTNTLAYNRKFYFGGGGNILFPTNAYQPIKKLFDDFHKADTHTITIRQK